MKIAGGLAASFIVATVAATGLASPASAEGFEGNYTMQLAAGEPATWTVTPCADDPNHQAFIPCVHVAESGSKYAPWQADATLSVGYWTLKVDRPDAITCDDGSFEPSQVTYSWNAVTLLGVLAFNFPGGCGDVPASSLAAPFSLTPNNPAPPVEA